MYPHQVIASAKTQLVQSHVWDCMQIHRELLVAALSSDWAVQSDILSPTLEAATQPLPGWCSAMRNCCGLVSSRDAV